MIKRWATFFSIVCVGLLTWEAAAQKKYTVEILLSLSLEAQTPAPVYLASNFNRWNPQDDRFVFQNGEQESQRKVLLQGVPEGVLEFKVTKGTWQTLECSAQGRLYNLRELVIESDTVIHHNVTGWREQFPQSTVPQRLDIITDFAMPQLARSRTIRVLLPEGYANSTKTYPVWYMHDGQDLFDEATSEGRIGPVEWGIDESLEALGGEYIIVGIDHEYHKNIREQEYSFFAAARRPIAEGKEYLDFIVHTLKPHIDTLYRTKSDVVHTGIAGGSLGGLISLYAGLSYPNVFGRVGVFSPSFWQDESQAIAYAQTLSKKKRKAIKKQVYYFYAGNREHRKIDQERTVQMHLDVLRFLGETKEVLPKRTLLRINPQGKHGAWYWKEAFTWMLANENYKP